MEIRKLEPIAQKARTLLLKSTKEKLHAILDNPNHEFRRAKPEAVETLVRMVENLGEQAIIDKVAYMWFNRFIALRFMDVCSFNPVKVLSANENETQIEIIALAETGVFDSRLTSQKTQMDVKAILSNENNSTTKYKDALSRLIVGACNKYSETMPFLFQKVDDYSELLIPDDLVSDDSTLALIRDAIDENAVEELGVSLIGWLYQFYISERKAEVIGSVVDTADIPAATQLFTPEWIVRYLVDNSLGRAWLEKNPDDELQAQLEYYIPGQQPASQTMPNDVTKLRLLDPCCGSGHMLVYAFDVFAKIYTRLGYSKSDIPGLILKNNLIGLELDERAAELAAFALVMKAMEYDRRFLFRPEVPKPNVTVISKIHFRDNDDQLPVLASRLASPETDAEQIEGLFHLFDNADAVGSLIMPDFTVSQLDALYSRYQAHKDDFSLFFGVDKMETLFRQTRLLADQYDVVVTNPPYMGNSGMNKDVKEYVQVCYPDSKSDLFAAFIERCLEFAAEQGFVGMVTMQSWMFLSSYETLRKRLIEENSILTMVHAGARAFDMIGGEVVQTTAFTMTNQSKPGYLGAYLRLIDGNSESEKMAMFKEAIRNPSCGWFYQTDSSDFKKIPGSPIAYWASDKLFNAFLNGKSLGELANVPKGLSTGSVDRFVRYWFEIDYSKIGFTVSDCEETQHLSYRWFPYAKGGTYRKWDGNLEYVVNWQNNGYEVKNFVDEKGKQRSRPQNTSYYFKKCLTYSSVTSYKLSLRYLNNSVFGGGGDSVHILNDSYFFYVLGFINSEIQCQLLKLISPTINYEVDHLKKLPVIIKNEQKEKIDCNVQSLISLSRRDWDSYETSWDFECNPLVTLAKERGSQSVLISDLYQRLREQWRADTAEMKRLEEENNRIFIDAYGLQDELSPEVPLSEVSLTCNPAYRYKLKSNEDGEKRLEQDTVKELLSYAVGCMMGRYSLDKPGLILADQGSTEQDYRTKTGSDYPIDPDGIIPMLDDNFRQDDIIRQLHTFLTRAFGESTLHDNLSYMETVLDKELRKYFQKDFFTDHVQMYKKRPIYWLFTSSKGGFSCLMYMHRYFSDTCSRILNQYLRLYKRKLSDDKGALESQLSSGSLSASARNALVKNVERIDKLLSELTDYERNALNRHAGDRIELDLDDGVKVNYVKFYPAVKKVI